MYLVILMNMIKRLWQKLCGKSDDSKTMSEMTLSEIMENNAATFLMSVADNGEISYNVDYKSEELFAEAFFMLCNGFLASPVLKDMLESDHKESVTRIIELYHTYLDNITNVDLNNNDDEPIVDPGKVI